MKHWKVYFIKEDRKYGNTKIGYTSDLSKRLQSIQVGNSNKLVLSFTLPCESLIHAQKLERFLHRQLYKRCHVSGEWFNLHNIYIPALIDKFNKSHSNLFEPIADSRNNGGCVLSEEDPVNKMLDLEHLNVISKYL